MGVDSYIGRVGALAVALGIGGAVATGSGLAFAQPSDSGTASGGSASESSDGSATTDGADSDPSDASEGGTPGNASDPEPSGPTVDEDENEGDTDESDSDDDDTDESDSDDDDIDDETEESDPDADVLPEPEPVDEEDSQDSDDLEDLEGSEESRESSESEDHTDSGGGSQPEADPPSPPGTTNDSLRREDDNDAQKQTGDDTDTSTTFATISDTTEYGTQARSFAATIGDPTMGSTAVAAPTPTGLVVGLVSSVLRWLGLGPSAGNPAVPAAPAPFLELIWAVFRRTEEIFNRTFVNTSPTALPEQIDQTAEGVVTGNVNASDEDGDAFVVKLSEEPGKGRVVVDADGDYVYFADDEFAATGGTDTFKVIVSDAAAGFHLHRPAGLLSSLIGLVSPRLADQLFPGGGHTYEATVEVSVNAPPQLVDPGVRFTDLNTGVVRGSVGITDPAGDPLVFYTEGATSGDIDVHADGTYTYTPTLAARLRADLTPEVEWDSFTVRGIDGQFATTRTISVRIVPAEATITDSFWVGRHPESVTFGADGSAYVGNRETGSISVIDTDTAQEVDEYTGRGDPVDVAAAPDGSRLWVLDRFNQELVSMDTATGMSAPTTTFVGPAARNVAVSPDGKRVYVTTAGAPGQGAGHFIVVDAETRNIVADVSLGYVPTSGGLAVSPDGNRVYVHGGGGVHVIDAEDNAEVDTIPLFANSNAIALSPDGKKLYLSNLNGDATGGGVLAVDIATKTVTPVATVNSINGLAVSRDGSVVFAFRSGNMDGSIWAIDTATYTVITPIAGASGYGQTYEDIAFSPDGRFAYLIDSNLGSDGAVHVISIVSADLPPV